MARPAITGVLETVLYYPSGLEDEIHHFYSEILGLRRLHPDGSAYRIGSSILLVFNRDRTAVQDDPPPHGATGSVHTCLTTDPGDLDRWREHLSEHGVAITQEQTWPGGARSLYFEDPAGNVIEIADGDPWPR